MNLKNQFYIFMLGEEANSDLSLIEVTEKALKNIKNTKKYSEFQKLKNMVGIEMALRQIFANQQISSQLTMNNVNYDYYLKPNGFMEMVMSAQDCVGRAVLAAGLIQAENLELQFGEVLKDWFANYLLQQDNQPLEVLKEVVYYEIPHAVVVINGKQFDPISAILPVGLDITHKIQVMDLYAGILGMCAVNFANSQTFNQLEKIDFLEEIYSINSQSPTVARNLGGALCMLDKKVSQKLLDTFAKHESLDSYLTQVIFRPELREEILNKIKMKYGKNIFDFIKNDYNFNTIFSSIYGGYDGI